MTKGTKQSGGARPGAGRPKGSLGLKCREQIEEIARLYPDWSPLRQFAEVANDTNLAPEIRLDAAKCAAPYVHARLKMTEADPEALLSLEEALAEIRARHHVRALKEGFGLAGLADRLERVRQELDDDSVPVVQISTLPAPTVIDAVPVITEPAMPSAQVEPLIDKPAATPAGEPAARHANAPAPAPGDWTPPTAYTPILWPAHTAFADGCGPDTFLTDY